ncbi:MAG: MFS transporter, partial [Erysipelotrichaceae bacterium]|nr:MFS transporter [Erysipelotrichaceae bacterium]
LFAIMPITTIITNWFKEKHGLATSIALSFSGLAGAICSPVLSSCINTLGWQKAYFVMAALIAICTLPALIFKVTITPAEVGLLPYGADEPIERKAAEKKAFNYLTLSFILMGCMTVMHTSITGISQHLSSYSVSLGLDAALGATMMSLTMVGNIFSKLAFGVLSDKIGPVKSAYTMQVTNIISLVMIMVGGNLHLVPLQLAGALLFGSIYSVGAVGIPLLTKKFFGAENFSSTFAIIGFLTSVGSASSLTLIGYLYDFTHTYVYMFIIAIIFHIVNMINITFINKKQA